MSPCQYFNNSHTVRQLLMSTDMLALTHSPLHCFHVTANAAGSPIRTIAPINSMSNHGPVRRRAAAGGVLDGRPPGRCAGLSRPHGSFTRLVGAGAFRDTFYFLFTVVCAFNTFTAVLRQQDVKVGSIFEIEA